MANSHLVKIKTDTQEEIKLRLIDNGDGTFSPATSLTGSTIPDSQAIPVVLTNKTTGALAQNNYNSDGRGVTGLNQEINAYLMALNPSSAADRLRVDAQKNLLVGLRNSSGQEPFIGSPQDGYGLGGTRGLQTLSVPQLYNSVTFDVERNNTEGTLLASAARTATTVWNVQTNYNARGVILFLKVTAAGTGGLALNLYADDPVTGDYGSASALLADSANITTTGLYVYLLYPSATTSGLRLTRDGALPRSWLGQITHVDGSSWTYSLGHALIV